MSRCWHILTVQKKNFSVRTKWTRQRAPTSGHKKAAEQLDRLNKDCNNTAGLQAVVKVAVGARVMLRRNTDTKGGLVNGAIGTILSISDRWISIKFDDANDLCDIERVKSAFMVMMCIAHSFPLF